MCYVLPRRPLRVGAAASSEIRHVFSAEATIRNQCCKLSVCFAVWFTSTVTTKKRKRVVFRRGAFPVGKRRAPLVCRRPRGSCRTPSLPKVRAKGAFILSRAASVRTRTLHTYPSAQHFFSDSLQTLLAAASAIATELCPKPKSNNSRSSTYDPTLVGRLLDIAAML